MARLAPDRQEHSKNQVLNELRRMRLVRLGNEITQSPGLLPTGLSELDLLLAGGWPKGKLSQVVAPLGGLATVLYAQLASVSSQRQFCALVDCGDGFDPLSACSCGVRLPYLLWVRPFKDKEAWQAAELILKCGGFAVLVLDLGLNRPNLNIPVAVWLRLRKRAADSRTVLLVLSTVALLGSLASCSVEVGLQNVHWRGQGEPWLEKVSLSFAKFQKELA